METVIRVAIVYVFILAGLRVLGKREFGQLAPMELVTLLLIPELVAQALVREDFSLTNGLVALTTLFLLVFLTSMSTHLSKRIGKVLESTPTILAHHGELVPENLNRERISPDEIYSEMHKVGLESLDQVRWVILETDGKMSIVASSDVRLARARPDIAL